MSLEQSYALLKPPQQEAALAAINAELWNLMDRIAALTADKAALMNAMMGHLTVGEVV